MFQALYPNQDKWPLKRTDDTPDEDKVSLWEGHDPSNEEDVSYDPEFDPTVALMRYYKVSRFIPAWICKWYGAVAYNLSTAPPSGMSEVQHAEQMCRMRTRNLDDTSRLPGAGNIATVRFIPGQCCPILGCSVGPDTRYPAHHQKYRLTPGMISQHWMNCHAE